MTTKVEDDGQSYLIPALGETWGHASTLRVILFWKGNRRFATLFKSPWKEEATVPFQITVTIQNRDSLTYDQSIHIENIIFRSVEFGMKSKFRQTKDPCKMMIRKQARKRSSLLTEKTMKIIYKSLWIIVYVEWC